VAKIEKAVPIRNDSMEKALSSKHQVGILSRNPAPATASTPSADTSGNASAKEGKK
jgi:hypothetical protein